MPALENFIKLQQDIGCVVAGILVVGRDGYRAAARMQFNGAAFRNDRQILVLRPEQRIGQLGLIKFQGFYIFHITSGQVKPAALRLV